MITKSSQHNEFITEIVKNRDHDYQKFTTHEFNTEIVKNRDYDYQKFTTQ